MPTYDSGANGHYISKHDQHKAGLPILRPSTRRVGVANGGTSNSKCITQLPFRKLSAQLRQADTFQDFPTSLMSMGKTSDDGTVSVFTKEGVNIFKEEDVLITCKGEQSSSASEITRTIPNTVDATTGPLATMTPIQTSKKALLQANSVYDLPSTKQAIKWMHPVCSYLVKSTWLKAINAGNYVGWPMLTERNVQKYYPEIIKTAKGHLNQTRKNARTTKVKVTPLETCDTSHLHGKKVRNVYTQTYMVQETTFSNQTGQFPI
jgi:hypothetical protein